MAEREFVDLGLVLLDKQLLDSDGRECGKVDDIEFEGGPGEEVRVTALDSGSGAWRAGNRGPVAFVAARIGASDVVRIAWESVGELGPAVRLKLTARQLGLGKGDDRAARWLKGLPRS